MMPTFRLDRWGSGQALPVTGLGGGTEVRVAAVWGWQLSGTHRATPILPLGPMADVTQGSQSSIC